MSEIMNTRKIIIGILKIMLVISVGLISVVEVLATPMGPSSITPLSSSRYPISGASNFSAIAGNVTEINFEANSVTSVWQGYFGNISGNIKLGNALNQTLYDWGAASPNGEIYATRSSTTPVWGSIRCANSSELDSEDIALSVNSAIEKDSVNNTFLNVTSFNAFMTGGQNINTTQNCYAVNLHDQTGNPSANFQEVILHDGSRLVYTAIVSQDSMGFDGLNHDFEMIVGEDGHNDDINPTTYYFYVELG
jgi:hypothetical protein